MKYFLRDEVAIHNKCHDLWLIIHRTVIDLTELIKDRRGHWNGNMSYLVAFGGKDISHLFNEDSQPKCDASPVTGRPRVLFPPIIETAMSDANDPHKQLWSIDPKYRVGRITRRERRLRIINTLTGRTHYMAVCDEDLISEIKVRYRDRYNHHAGSYLWRKPSRGKKRGTNLQMDKTLDENGLVEVQDDTKSLPPAILLYYLDNFSIA